MQQPLCPVYLLSISDENQANEFVSGWIEAVSEQRLENSVESPAVRQAGCESKQEHDWLSKLHPSFTKKPMPRTPCSCFVFHFVVSMKLKHHAPVF